MRSAVIPTAVFVCLVATNLRADEVLAEGSYWDDDHCTIYTAVTVRHSDGSIATETVIGGEVDGIAQAQFPLYGGIIGTGSGVSEYVQTKTTGGVALHWRKSCVFMTPDTAGTADLAFDDVLGAIDGAAAAWTTGAATCSYMHLEATTPIAVDTGNDGVNAVKFRSVGCPISCGNLGWCRPAHGSNPDVCYPGAATAITTATFVKDGSTEAGLILDADVEVNTVQWAFAVGCEDTCMTLAAGATHDSTVDLQNTLTHEFGHVLGLDHTCWNGIPPQPTDNLGNPTPSCSPANALPVSITGATMYALEAPEEVSKRVPKADDIAGVCADYPLAADPKKCEPEDGKLDSSGGCSVAPGGPGRGGLVLFGLAALAWIRDRRRRPCYTA